MHITVHRMTNGEKACLGRADIEEIFECFTLEDVIRELGPNGEGKIFEETGIPAGLYRVTMTFSNRFQRVMPLINEVPFFTGIRIHSGCSDKNTSGCLLVGKQALGEDYIRGGFVEAPELNRKIQAAINQGEEVWIEFKNEFPEALK